MRLLIWERHPVAVKADAHSHRITARIMRGVLSWRMHALRGDTQNTHVSTLERRRLHSHVGHRHGKAS